MGCQQCNRRNAQARVHSKSNCLAAFVPVGSGSAVERCLTFAALLRFPWLSRQSLPRRFTQLSYDNDQIRILMTLPGVGPAGAQALCAAPGDWRRFKDGAHAASYLGLSPSTRQSANHCHHHGSITKAGNSLARWMLTQAARQVAQHPGPLGVFFRRIHKRKNFNVAVVATARKLVTIGFLMLKNGEPYRYSLPGPTQRKLSAFRVEATGCRRSKSKVRLPVQRREQNTRVQSIPSLRSLSY
jgi:transposase